MLCFLLPALALLAPAPAVAQGECIHPFYWGQLPGYSPRPNNCFGSTGFRCYQGVDSAPFLRLKNPACDPNVGSCTVQLGVPFEFPGLEDMIDEDGLAGSPTPRIFWFDQPTAPSCPGSNPNCGQVAICGTFGFGGRINSDFMETWIERPGVTCSNIGSQPGVYSIRAMVCVTACRVDTVAEGLRFDDPAMAAMIGCRQPRWWSCPEPSPNSCPLCKPGGTSPAGGGPGIGGPGAPGGPWGPGAQIYYAAGGAGGDGLPGTPTWSSTLGRYWSHDYAMRIFLDPVGGTDDHVWLITPQATFREFTDLSGGVYGTVAPSDEYRTLLRTAGGWELHELNGTVHAFDSVGRWISSTDRNGNAKVATLDGSGRLGQIDFPDGRSETFTYDASGKLASITEVGVDDGGGSPPELPWTYTWSGDDLVRIDRPDGTAVELTYGDFRFPGYLTLVELVGTDTSRRVERAWAYDDSGNVVDTWQGDLSPTGPDAVDRWQFNFDSPEVPTVATVTDPLGDDATYAMSRDTNTTKPKLLSLDGDCPVCGMGSSTTLAYGDPGHPLLPTSETDSEGNVTLFDYDVNGRMSSRTEAFGTTLERTTEWTYDPSFPSLPTQVRQPSVAGGGALRTTTFLRDANGNVTTERIEGSEGGQVFSYDTVLTYNAAGAVLSVDPPGYGSNDVTSFTYDPLRGGLLASSRTDPLVGTTSFQHDPFNRLVQQTDPNGLVVETTYDALDRMTQVIQHGASPAGDLVTATVYDPFGDLLRTVLPRGNVVEQGYDAAGRLVSIERKPDAATPGERQLFTLDGAGNRTRVDLQRHDGSTWVTESFTEYVFSTRCYLSQVVRADGSTVDNAYDCNGNLTSVWDENHDPATDPPTVSYQYDELERLTTTSRPWAGAGGGSAITSFGYDVQDHLISVLDPEGNLTTYTQSDRDLLTTEVSPATGTTSYAYNEHGKLTSSTDARGVTVTRALDALDRVTAVTYPDPDLGSAFTYDDPAVPFSKGRLTAISRHGTDLTYEYDRFGRITRDGWLTYEYDANGNRTRIGYPFGTLAVDAVYTFDFADRQATLTMESSGGAPEPLVTAAAYKPFGPLSQAVLGNGLTEDRSYDARYRPLGITVGGGKSTLLDWSYSIDGVSNITAITDALDPKNDRVFDYQDNHYFMTQGDGPWGDLSWDYDRTGNRLSETRDGLVTNYSYASNPGGGNSPLLTQVGSVPYSYDAAGNLVGVGSLSPLSLDYDDEGRLAGMSRPDLNAADLLYDGRGFLGSSVKESPPFGGKSADALATRTQEPIVDRVVAPLYDSQGLLRQLHVQLNPSGPFDNSRWHDVLYFAGRPLAVWRKSFFGLEPDRLTYVTTDHLGAPVLATDDTGGVLWQGGFEPFGADYSGALDQEVFLRLPGQWADEGWDKRGVDSGLYYNLRRWYESGTGRYSRPDPVGLSGGNDNLFVYAQGDPLSYADPTGLQLVVVPDDPYFGDPLNPVPPDCSGGPWRFIRYVYRDKGLEEVWKLIRAEPIRIARMFGAAGPAGAGGGTLGCLCVYALEGIYRVTEQLSEWQQTVSCPPCQVYDRTALRPEREYRRRVPYMAPRQPMRRHYAPLCSLCPPTLKSGVGQR